MMRIVVVDGDVVSRAEMVKTLTLAGMHVVDEAEYGVAAVSSVRDNHPDAVLVHVEEPVARPLQTVRTITETSPHALVVVYSEANSGEAVRRAVSAGAREYVVAPCSSEEIRAQLTELAARVRRWRERDGVPLDVTGTVICVHGAKGGIGKTTVAVNLACALQQVTNADIVLADMDTRFGDSAIAMGVEPQRTIADWVRDGRDVSREEFERYLTPHPSGVRLFASPHRPIHWADVVPEDLTLALGTLASQHDFVVVDLPGVYNELVAAVLDTATVLLMLTTLDVASVKDTAMSLELLCGDQPTQTDRLKVIVNDATGVPGLAAQDLEGLLHFPVFWLLPRDRTVGISMQHGEPLVRSHPRSPFARSVVELAGRLAGVRVDVSSPWWRRLLGRREAQVA